MPHSSRRSLKTRNALLTAGVDLLATRSIDSISIDELVQTANVAKGSFFNHFEDKQKFGELIARQIRAEMESHVAVINADIDDPAERLVRGICLFIALALDDPKRATILLRGHEWATEKDNPLNAGLYADLRRGVESGRFCRSALDGGIAFVTGIGSMAVVQILDQSLDRKTATARAQSLLYMTLLGLNVSETDAAAISQKTVEVLLFAPVEAVQ